MLDCIEVVVGVAFTTAFAGILRFVDSVDGLAGEVRVSVVRS